MKKMLEKFKKSKSSLALVILALVLIIVGISFALFSPSINLLGRRNIKISKCELDINFKESDELMLVSKYPIKDSEALKLKAKDVVITNNSTCDTAYYKLTIKDLNNSSINKSKIKFQLVDKTSGDTTNGSNPNTFLVEDSLANGDSKSYEIRLWIDESATNSDIYINGDTSKPIEYKYALNLEAYDEKSENAEIVPILNIPVGTNGIEKITHEIDDTLQVDSRFATEYRYRGGSSAVNNYVYFSCSSLTEQNGENCSTARIIGVIPTEDTDGNVENRLKIILTNDIGVSVETSWDENDSNNWAVSSLNGYLNAMEGLLGMLTDVDRSMIGTTKYYLGGYYNAEVSSDEMWQIERKNESNALLADSNPVMQNDANKKIALMYASDYGYAASKECKEFLSSYSSNSVCQDDNWLHNTGNANEWIITHDSEYEQFCYAISADGDIAYHVGVNAVQLGVRPVLTLSSNVKISGGSGTSDDPYQLSI